MYMNNIIYFDFIARSQQNVGPGRPVQGEKSAVDTLMENEIAHK